MPPTARWAAIKDIVKNVGDGLNKALGALEEANHDLDGVVGHIDFNRKVGQSKIPDRKLRELIRHFNSYRLRNEDFEFPDLLGAAYEYLIGDFADSAGKKGGEFYTPRSVVRMMVRLVAPKPGDAVYDPCAGSGGMLILAKEYVDEHGHGMAGNAGSGWAGEERRRLGHLQDEHAAARHPRRRPPERRHARRPAAHRRRRAEAVRPGDHQSAVLAELRSRRGHAVTSATGSATAGRPRAARRPT